MRYLITFLALLVLMGAFSAYAESEEKPIVLAANTMLLGVGAGEPGSGIPPAASVLLMNTGSNFLLNSGDKLLLND